MQIVHGTWIPDETEDFVQGGGFYLWVETDAPLGPAPKRGAARRGAEHPRQLTGAALAAFLTEKLGVKERAPEALARTFATRYFLLPSADGRPLPSFELAPYVDEELPDESELTAWSVCCYRLPTVISTLNEIQFIALHAAEDFQLGADLQFWQQHAQAIRGIIGRDQYIPALTYQALPAAKGKRPTKKGAEFALHPGWEIVSETYETAIARHVAAMPLVCTAGLSTLDNPALFDAETLLRHFSECLLRDVVNGTAFPAAFERRIIETLLYRCVFPDGPLPHQGPAEALAE